MTSCAHSWHRAGLASVAATAVAWLIAAAPAPQLVAVRHPQGSLHGYLVLRTLDGATVADGDSIQTVAGDRVVDRTIFHFRDGSVDDEVATFSQHGVYRLVAYHHAQTGPAFHTPTTVDFDLATGHVVTRWKDDRDDHTDDRRMALPPDLCNGILITLLQELDGRALPLTAPFLASTPEPRLVHLVVTRVGASRFLIGASPRTAIEYLVRTDIGGVTGLLAHVLGKQPADGRVWIEDGDVPSFVKSEAPMYDGSPVLRTELTSPTWPRH